MDDQVGEFRLPALPFGPQVILRCPLAACSWDHRPEPPPPAMPLSGAEDAMIAHVIAVEAVIRAHLETHTLLEWVSEVTRLQAERDLLAREAREAGLIVSVLVRRLGGQAVIADAELAAETGTMVREPAMWGFILRTAA